MFRWVLFGVPCHGLIKNANFNVIKCNNDNGQPELTFTIEEQYFKDNLSWQADQEGFIFEKNVVVKIENPPCRSRCKFWIPKYSLQKSPVRYLEIK